MSSQEVIPTLSSENRPAKHHPHTRYYARRVRRSLANRITKLICAIFLTLLLIIGILGFILWLSLRPHRPRFHVRSFSMPALNLDNGFQNARLTFDITARNPNQYIGIYYDAMGATVYYKDQRIGVTPLLFPFYQPSKNTTWIHAELSGNATLNFINSDEWKAFMDDRAKGTVVFRLNMRSTIRFKVYTWNSRHHRMHASCNVGVGQDGLILPTSKDKRCSVYFI